MKKYAGIGSRKAPPEILDLCTRLAERLAKLGYTLRSGGADGCDLAFETGARYTMEGAKLCEIFIPWRGFNGNLTGIYNVDPELQIKLDELAELYHPKWHSLRESVKKLMGRNGQQIFGQFLNDPVDFVICWTPDGCESDQTRTGITGGTGQAISIASDNGIRVFNLRNKQSQFELFKLLDELS